MKTWFVICPILILTVILFACQNTKKADSRLNLDFEKTENDYLAGWGCTNYSGSTYFDNNYTISIDSVDVENGKHSTTIEFTGDIPSSAKLEFSLPENYGGKKILLSGYIKTVDVTDGYAGLLINLYPFVAYNDTTVKISGTNDWKKYEVAMNLHPNLTGKIIIGGYLSGKGKIWLDNFKITIDGVDVQYLKPYIRKIFPDEKDTVFNMEAKIVFPELNEQKIDDLELLGRIWGCLKYHHPAIANGNYNWDNELFRFLPAYLKISDNKQRDRTLLKWIHKYGKVPNCKDCQATSDSAFLKPDLSWIDKSNMNGDLKNILKKIYLNRYQGAQYYVRMVTNIDCPLFMNERIYTEMSYPDARFQLLALYRYWNIINYFYPYKYLTDKDWNDVLKEYIPYFINTNSRLGYELAVTRLIGEVCDTHAGLWEGGNKIDSLRGEWQIPVQVRYIENKWVVTDYYMNPSLSKARKEEQTGLKIGDIITHINGQSVEYIVDSIKKYYPASNEAARMRNIAGDLLRSNEHTLHINYISSNQLKQKEICLEKKNDLYYYIYKKDTTKCYKFINNNIGYISLQSIKDKDVSIIKREFMNTKGIIIDIRNYPSANILYSLSSYFVSKPTPFVKFTKVNLNNPGEFNFIGNYENPKSEKFYQGKLIVIVNEKTQSAAEFDAMAFRAGENTTIIGSQTAGADGNAPPIELPGGLKTLISGIGIYHPDGRETQRIGIVPDIEIKPTIKGIREGRDEVLEKAIEIIKSSK
jgi:C-terminal processing protease CtpA/Prc